MHADEEALLLVQPAEHSAEYSEPHELSTHDLQSAEALPKSDVGTQLPLLLPLSLLELHAGTAAKPSNANAMRRGFFMFFLVRLSSDDTPKIPTSKPAREKRFNCLYRLRPI